MIKRIYRLNGVNMEYILKEKFNHTDLYINRHLWKYDYLITKIINKMIYSKKFKHELYKGYYQLSTNDLINKFGYVRIDGKKNELYSVIRNELKEIGLLKFYTIENKIEDKFNRIAVYKITDEFLSRGYSEVEYKITDVMVSKISEIKQYEGIYKTLRDNLSIISIDYDGAISFTKNALKTKMPLKPKINKDNYQWDFNRVMDIQTYSKWIKYINDVNDGCYHFNVDLVKTGRVFNFITSLPSALRKFIKINNKAIVELDISNSQPLILNSNLDTSFEDVKLYKKLCEEGIFYSYMENRIKENGLETDDRTFKVDFFSKIYFSTEKRNSKWRTIFNNEFPNVAKTISEIKKENHVDLAIKLQRKEAEIFINTISKKCINEGINEFFTIHDAIYTTEDNVDEVYNILLESFKENGLNPTIKLKKHI